MKAYSISSSEIRVTWKPPSPGPGRPKGYEVGLLNIALAHSFFVGFFWSRGAETLFAPRLQVSYWRDGDQEESGRKQRTAKNETSMILTGLEGNSVYLVTVKGYNSIGQGPATAAVTVRTRRAREWCRADANHATQCVGEKRCSRVLLSCPPAPAQPPNNLVWIQEGNNVSLNWDPVKAKENESDVIGYMVTTCSKVIRSFSFFKVPLKTVLWSFFFQPISHSVNRSAFTCTALNHDHRFLKAPTEPLYNPCKSAENKHG